MTTLVAMFKRPDGGADALAAFERAYAETHLPIVAETPGLRGLRLLRIGEALGATTDLVLICEMDFDDRAALDAGLASEAMRAGGRNLRGSRRDSSPSSSPSRARRCCPRAGADDLVHSPRAGRPRWSGRSSVRHTGPNTRRQRW